MRVLRLYLSAFGLISFTPTTWVPWFMPIWPCGSAHTNAGGCTLNIMCQTSKKGTLPCACAGRVRCATLTESQAYTPSVVKFLTDVARIPHERASLVPNGIDLEQFRAAAASPQHRLVLGLPPKGQLIGCVGNLRVEKNHQLGLQALARLANKENEIHLILCGDGDQRSKLECLAQSLCIADRVTFLGFRLDVPEILAALDLVLLPSSYEGLPISVLEAWASSKPIVATAVSGIEELVRDGEDGMLVPPNDPDQMAVMISRVLGDRALAGKLSAAGQRRVFQEYGIEAMVEGYDRIYIDLIGRSKCAG